jgi:transcriptional regulator with XRE-family HTH domain
MAHSSDTDDSALSLFAAELQAARAKAGMSREDLAARINYSASLIGMVETMRRVPRLDFAQRCDQAFGTTGTFARLHRHLRTAPFPAWFRPFAQHEATSLRWFEMTLVPGLLQTADYSRALLSTRIGADEDEIEQSVAARLERQTVLDRENPAIVVGAYG